MAKIAFDLLTFGNASTRWLGPYKGTIEEVLGSFGANVKAVVTDTFDGESRTGIQIEGSRKNTVFQSQTIDQFSSLVRISVNANTTEVTDPLGGNIAEELVPSTDNDSHIAREWSTLHYTVFNSGRYCISVFAQDGGYDVGLRVEFSGDSFAIFNSDTWALLSSSDIVEYGVDQADGAGDWGNVWCSFDRIYTQATTARYYIDVTDGSVEYYVGDGSSSLYAWQAQFEEGYFPSSIIPTASSEVTRAADNAYWAEGDVDSNLRGEITLYVIPQFSSAALFAESGTHTVLHFDDVTQDIQVYFEAGTSAGTGRIVVNGASALVTTGNHTWSRGQLLKIVISPTSGEVITSLFTSGNGIHSGSSWSTDDGDVYLGQSSSNAEQFFGVIFEPEYEGGVTTRYLIATVLGVSATPDDIAVTETRSLQAIVAGSSSTPEVISTSIRALLVDITSISTASDIAATQIRYLIATLSSSSSTPNTVESTTTRNLLSSIATSSVTPDVAITLARAIVANIVCDSVTSDIVSTSTRSLVADMPGASVTPSILATLTRDLLASILGVSITPSISTTIIRTMLADVVSASTTSDILETIVRTIIAAPAGVSVTTDITAVLGDIISLLANVFGVSATLDAVATTTRSIVADIVAASITTDITVTIAGLISLLANIEATSTTSDLDVTVSRGILANIDAQSITSDITQIIDIGLLADLHSTSFTSDALASSVRAINATILGSSITPDIALVVARSMVAVIIASSDTPDIVATLEGLINLIAGIAASSVTPEIAASTLRSIIAELSAVSSTPDISIVLAYAIRMYNGVQLKSHTPATDTDLRMWANGGVIGIPVISATNDTAGSIRIMVNSIVKALERAN